MRRSCPVAVLLACLLAACGAHAAAPSRGGSGGTSGSASHSSVPRAVPGTSGPAPSSAGTPGPSSTAAAPPPAASLPPGGHIAAGWSLALLGPGFGGPDDLAAAGGTLYFSDIHAGELGALPSRGGAPRVVARGLDVPEGIAPLTDGSLLVMEQGRNRILRIIPSTGVATRWLSLDNPTHLEGVDGMALTARGLLIPDSPVGRLLLQPLSGHSPSGAPAVLASSGMTRPTAAVQAPGGDIYLADEIGGAVLVLAPGARAPRRLAALPSPDDLALLPNGRLLVSCLNGSVREVDPAGGSVAVVVSGLGSLQGLAADDGGYAVADESGNRIYLLRPPG